MNLQNLVKMIWLCAVLYSVAFFASTYAEIRNSAPRIEAVYTCSQQGMTLPQYWTDVPAEELLRYPEGLWIWLQRNPSFHWLNGDVFETPVDAWKKHPSKDCGVLNFVDKTFEADSCEERHKFLCELPGCSECPKNDVIHCFAVNDTAFILHDQKQSWPAARNDCREHKPSGTLIQGSDTASLLKIIKKMNLQATSVIKVWVGYRKNIWKSGTIEHTDIPWAPREPSRTGDCAVVFHNRTNRVVRAVQCTSSQAFICVKGQPQDTSSENYHSTESYTTSSPKPLVIDNNYGFSGRSAGDIAWMVLVVLILTGILAVGILIYVRPIWQFECLRGLANEKKKQDETRTLEHQDEKKEEKEGEEMREPRAKNGSLNIQDGKKKKRPRDPILEEEEEEEEEGDETTQFILSVPPSKFPSTEGKGRSRSDRDQDTRMDAMPDQTRAPKKYRRVRTTSTGASGDEESITSANK